MTQGERVKKVRKHLGLTMEKFGEKLGVQKSAISKIEKNENNLTDANIKAICREFHVDYFWLTTGEGDDMFVDMDDNIIESIDRIMIGENEFHKNLFKTFVKLDEAELLALESILNKFIEVSKKTDSINIKEEDKN